MTCARQGRDTVSAAQLFPARKCLEERNRKGKKKYESSPFRGPCGATIGDNDDKAPLRATCPLSLSRRREREDCAATRN